MDGWAQFFGEEEGQQKKRKKKKTAHRCQRLHGRQHLDSRTATRKMSRSKWMGWQTKRVCEERISLKCRSAKCKHGGVELKKKCEQDQGKKRKNLHDKAHFLFSSSLNLLPVRADPPRWRVSFCKAALHRTCFGFCESCQSACEGPQRLRHRPAPIGWPAGYLVGAATLRWDRMAAPAEPAKAIRPCNTGATAARGPMTARSGDVAAPSG